MSSMFTGDPRWAGEEGIEERGREPAGSMEPGDEPASGSSSPPEGVTDNWGDMGERVGASFPLGGAAVEAKTSWGWSCTSPPAMLESAPRGASIQSRNGKASGSNWLPASHCQGRANGKSTVTPSTCNLSPIRSSEKQKSTHIIMYANLYV